MNRYLPCCIAHRPRFRARVPPLVTIIDFRSLVLVVLDGRVLRRRVGEALDLLDGLGRGERGRPSSRRARRHRSAPSAASRTSPAGAGSPRCRRPSPAPPRRTCRPGESVMPSVPPLKAVSDLTLRGEVLRGRLAEHDAQLLHAARGVLRLGRDDERLAAGRPDRAERHLVGAVEAGRRGDGSSKSVGHGRSPTRSPPRSRSG